MNLPNYFLADLPPEAELSPSMITEACRTLKRNREQYLVGRSTSQLVKVIASVAENWLEADYPFRQLALERGPHALGFSRATLERGLDAFFQTLTQDNLHALLVQDLGHAQRFDEMVATTAESKSQRAAMVMGPEMLVHLAAGNIPNPTLLSIVLGFLARSAQFVKCARGTTLLPRLFAHSIYDADPKLASCLEIAEWPGGTVSLEEPLFAESDCLTVTGSDETLTAVRARLPMQVRLLGYGHRVSFGYVAGEALSGFGVKKLIARVADDVVAWDQLGCLSPHVIYVENGGAMAGEQLAELLAEELARRELAEPRGGVGINDAATIASRRDFYRVRSAASTETRLWCSEGSTAWTVVYEADGLFQLSCLHRFIYVKSVAGMTDALQQADAVRGHVSTVGIAAHGETTSKLAVELVRWGVTRVCPLGRMQHPLLTWRHDGRLTLGDLVTWTDWEQ